MKLQNLCLAAFAALKIAGSAQAATACADLLPGTVIGNAQIINARTVNGTIAGAGQQKVEAMPDFCRVLARAKPEPASHVLIEVWLPVPAKWNGKLLGIGNGGAAGVIQVGPLGAGVKRGYVSVDTDMGMWPSTANNAEFLVGIGRPEVAKDFGHRATHEAAILAKELALRHYGKPARKAYFTGCSTGGQQALMEAQRYPDDYDGIIAGAPANNRTHLHTMLAALAIFSDRPNGMLTPEVLQAWKSRQMRQCLGRSGGAPGDTFLADPTQCTLSPREMACKPGQETSSCLSEGQIRTLELIYSGLENPRTGELIHPPFVYGGDGLIAAVSAGPHTDFNFDLARWALGAQFAPAKFDFDRDMDRVDAALGADLNAMDTDLSRFAARGGKLIMHHGWADSLITPLGTISYFDRITARGAERAAFARLFMAPGMDHCGGGEGPNAFGQYVDGSGDPSNDVLAALERWTEEGIAPEAIIATRFVELAPGVPDTTQPALASRPLCPYPAAARYKGSGDPTKAESFTCTAASPASYRQPAARYLR